MGRQQWKTKIDGWQLMRGWTAAREGIAYDTKETPDWQDGWTIWDRGHRERKPRLTRSQQFSSADAISPVCSRYGRKK